RTVRHERRTGGCERRTGGCERRTGRRDVTPEGANVPNARRVTCARCATPFPCTLDGGCWCAAETYRMPVPVRADRMPVPNTMSVPGGTPVPNRTSVPGGMTVPDSVPGHGVSASGAAAG